MEYFQIGYLGMLYFFQDCVPHGMLLSEKQVNVIKKLVWI